MSTLIRSAFVAAALLTSVSAAMAAPRVPTVPDQSDQYGGYAPNSQDGQRAFWDNQARHGN